MSKAFQKSKNYQNLTTESGLKQRFTKPDFWPHGRAIGIYEKSENFNSLWQTLFELCRKTTEGGDLFDSSPSRNRFKVARTNHNGPSISLLLFGLNEISKLFLRKLINFQIRIPFKGDNLISILRVSKGILLARYFRPCNVLSILRDSAQFCTFPGNTRTDACNSAQRNSNWKPFFSSDTMKKEIVRIYLFSIRNNDDIFFIIFQITC